MTRRRRHLPSQLPNLPRRRPAPAPRRRIRKRSRRRSFPRPKRRQQDASRRPKPKRRSPRHERTLDYLSGYSPLFYIHFQCDQLCISTWRRLHVLLAPQHPVPGCNGYSSAHSAPVSYKDPLPYRAPSLPFSHLPRDVKSRPAPTPPRLDLPVRRKVGPQYHPTGDVATDSPPISQLQGLVSPSDRRSGL